MTTAASNGRLKDRFCANPWTYVEIYKGGGVYVCCPAWNGNRSIGNIFHSSADEIWNSYQAVLFREGILNGSFDQCDHKKCPYITGNSLPTRKEARNGWHGPESQAAMDQGLTKLVRGPKVVKLGYDASCNLWCPSCRAELIVAKKAEQVRLRRIRDEFIVPFLKDAAILVMSSDGDPFASNHYREVMAVTHERLPSLKLGLCTNAVLFDANAWRDCKLDGRLDAVQVSVDAAKAETYAHVRRGGDFDRLLDNLVFLGRQRRASAFTKFDLLFVVQTCNFEEMPDFIRLGQRLGADSVEFMLIDHWDRGMTHSEYRASKVWDPLHFLYRKFLTVLSDPIFREPIVKMPALEMLLEGGRPGAIEVQFSTGEIHRSA